MVTLWSTPVREYMSRALISVLPSTSLSDVQKILEDRDVSAVPVIDEHGALRGIVSTADLLRVARIDLTTPGGIARVTPPLDAARDIMQTDVATIDEAAPVRDAAAKMVERRVHRLVALRKGSPAGIISTRDAMRAVLFHHIEMPLERVMTTPVETIDLGEPIDAAIAQLTAANVRGLVVVDGERAVGVFTQTEAIKARALSDELRKSPVEQVMSYETLCLDVSTPLYRAAGHAIQMRVRRILAVEQRRFCGIVTGFDLVRVMTMDEA